MNGCAGFSVDREKRLRLPGVDCSSAKSDWHSIDLDLSVGTQVVEFPAVLAPTQALRSLAGYQKTFPVSMAKTSEGKTLVIAGRAELL